MLAISMVLWYNNAMLKNLVTPVSNQQTHETSYAREQLLIAENKRKRRINPMF